MNGSLILTACARPRGASCSMYCDPDAPPRPVADRRADLGVRVADDDPDVADAGCGDRLDAVEQHRLVGDRHELLGARVGERPQAGALAAAENQSLHESHRWPPNAPKKFENVPRPARTKAKFSRRSLGSVNCLRGES